MSTLKQEKKRRNIDCQKRFGDTFEYDPSIDVYKHKSLLEFARKIPFKTSDCKRIPENLYSAVDTSGRYYPQLFSKERCKRVNGIWNDQSINRENFKDDGVCWRTSHDAYCSSRYDKKELLDPNYKGPKNYVFMQAKRDCNNDNKCIWEDNQCLSRLSTSEREVGLPKDWPRDITIGNIQEYLLKYYMGMKKVIPPMTQPLFEKGNRCKQNEEQPKLLSLQQSVVHVIMKGIASVPTSNRGLLAWHSTGSGKSLTATLVMDAFWESDKDIVFVTSVDALRSNPPTTFHKLANTFLHRFKNKSQDAVEKEFQSRKVHFMSFAQLAHYLLIAKPLKRVKKPADIERHQNFLSNAVLIIDEVHNLFKPLPNQRLENDAVKEFLTREDNPYTANMKVVILTATPGDDTKDIITLLNIVRDRSKPPIMTPDVTNKDDMRSFQQSIKGLVSYYDMSRDYTRFPKVVMLPATRSQMSMKQFLKYVDEYNGMSQEQRSFQELEKQHQISKYMMAARKYSNMLYEFETDMLLNEFSAKLPALLDNLLKFPSNKHYVYSAFYEKRGFGGQGINAVAKTLEQLYGYKKFTVDDAKKALQGTLSPGKRYILGIRSELSDNVEKLNTLVKAFNMNENRTGAYCNVFLASQGFNEGVDLKAVRHIHIFEPLLTFAMEKQTLGRAARFCSHSDLSKENGEWNVKVHRYISDQPKDLSMFNVNYLRDRAAFLKEELDTLEGRLEGYKGRRNIKEIREELKGKIAVHKAAVRDVEKELKKVAKMNLENVRMVDEQITKESAERAGELLVLYDAIKRSAVDYFLFEDFHKS